MGEQISMESLQQTSFWIVAVLGAPPATAPRFRIDRFWITSRESFNILCRFIASHPCQSLYAASMPSQKQTYASRCASGVLRSMLQGKKRAHEIASRALWNEVAVARGIGAGF